MNSCFYVHFRFICTRTYMEQSESKFLLQLIAQLFRNRENVHARRVVGLRPSGNTEMPVLQKTTEQTLRSELQWSSWKTNYREQTWKETYARIHHLPQTRKHRLNAQMKFTIHLIGPDRGRSPISLILNTNWAYKRGFLVWGRCWIPALVMGFLITQNMPAEEIQRQIWEICSEQI